MFEKTYLSYNLFTECSNLPIKWGSVPLPVPLQGNPYVGTAYKI